MASYSDYSYRINGVVNTNKTVMQNMETLASAAAAWISYDSHDGLWSVVINEAGSSIASFDDSNIIGSITISGTGLGELYNSVRVEFPHIDLRDEKDYIHDSLPAEDLFPNEVDNVLNIQYDILNDPVQAEYLGLIELKQNRIDRVIQFRTDFSKLGLKAGDLIDVTSSVYGFTEKMFRIEKLVESDTDSGSIEIGITAREYDANVYSTDDLYRIIRTTSTGITTLGNIGVPGTPTVNKFEKDARPRVTVESTTPTGTVESLEFWVTTGSESLDENRYYYLLDTVKPSTGNTFSYGTEVSITNDTLVSGNLHVKTRGVNGQTIGPFSSPAGFVYTPVQTTNNIDENTTASSSTGGLITALSALTLLNNLDQLFSGNTAAGSVFTKVFDLLKDKTGVDLVNTEDAGVSSPLVTFHGQETGVTATTTLWEPATDLVFTLDAASTITLDTRFNYGIPGSPTTANTQLYGLSEIRGGDVPGVGTLYLSKSTSSALVDQYTDLDTYLVGELAAGTYNISIYTGSDQSTTCTISGQLAKVSGGLIFIE